MPHKPVAAVEPYPHPQRARGAGRYAPSPSGDLHFGNLRTAVIAWLCARATGRRFVMRVEDLDQQRSSLESARRQLEDLRALGVTWEEPVVYQHERFAAYQRALEELQTRGMVYECYCSRKDIREASRAPHAIPGQYPGTCRNLSDEQRAAERERLARDGRVPALRLRAEVDQWTVRDQLAGEFTGDVDDMILRRGGQDAGWAYNLAVVIDDAFQGVDQVVRGDDLLASAPRQAYLAHLLGLSPVEYVHVPLVLGADGKRLAKRDGAVTLRQLIGDAASPADVLEEIAASLGVGGARSMAELVAGFDVARLPREPVVFRGVKPGTAS